MSGTRIVLKLNQQQLELVDRTLDRCGVADRETLIRTALRELAGKRTAERRGAAS